MSLCPVVLGVLVTCAAPTPAPFPAEARVPGDRWLAEDKIQHFAISFAATSMTYGAVRVILEPAPARTTAAGVAVVLGIGKELMDARRGGPFSLKDLAWDAAGVALGYTFVQRID